LFIEFILIVIDPVMLWVYVTLVLFVVVEHVPKVWQFVKLAPDALVAFQGVAV